MDPLMPANVSGYKRCERLYKLDDPCTNVYFEHMLHVFRPLRQGSLITIYDVEARKYDTSLQQNGCPNSQAYWA